MIKASHKIKRAPSSEFVSSSIPLWQILTAHAQPFSGARDLAFCVTVPLDLPLVWASSGGSGETARMRRLAWTFAARTGDKYQIRLTRSKNKMKKKWSGTDTPNRKGTQKPKTASRITKDESQNDMTTIIASFVSKRNVDSFFRT